MFELNRVEQLHAADLSRRTVITLDLLVTDDQKTALVLAGGGSATRAIQSLLDGLLPAGNLSRAKVATESVRSLLREAISCALLELFREDPTLRGQLSPPEAASPEESDDSNATEGP